MKALYFTILLSLCVVNLHSQSLSAKIIYNVSSENVLPPEPEYLNFGWTDGLKTIADEKPIKFILTIHGHEALFEPEFDLPTKKKLGYTYDRAAKLAEHDKIYYYNGKTGQSFFQSFWSKHYLVSVDRPEWTYTDETKKIGGYNCKKAVLSTKFDKIKGLEYVAPVEAWFTPEIQTGGIGIQYLHGLPGLMLEVTSYFDEGTITFTATSIDLNLERNISIEKPRAEKLISQTEYVEMIKKRVNNRNRM